MSNRPSDHSADSAPKKGGGILYLLDRIGAAIAYPFVDVCTLVSSAVGIFWMGLHPSRWNRAVRTVFVRQILFTAFEAVGAIVFCGLLIGLGVVLQASLAFFKLGQESHLGKVLVMVIVREVGPLMVNLFVIARSGTAIASEIATMVLMGDTRVLESQGMDLTHYLLLPRCFGVAVSVFLLTVIFVIVSICTGGLASLCIPALSGQTARFFNEICAAVVPTDIINLVAKSFIPGFLTALICCRTGSSSTVAVTMIPIASAKGVVQSLTTLLVVTILITLLTYL